MGPMNLPGLLEKGEDLPDEYQVWSEGKWVESAVCEQCNSYKFGLLKSRHHW